MVDTGKRLDNAPLAQTGSELIAKIGKPVWFLQPTPEQELVWTTWLRNQRNPSITTQDILKVTDQRLLIKLLGAVNYDNGPTEIFVEWNQFSSEPENSTFAQTLEAIEKARRQMLIRPLSKPEKHLTLHIITSNPSEFGIKFADTLSKMKKPDLLDKQDTIDYSSSDFS